MKREVKYSVAILQWLGEVLWLLILVRDFNLLYVCWKPNTVEERQCRRLLDRTFWQNCQVRLPGVGPHWTHCLWIYKAWWEMWWWLEALLDIATTKQYSIFSSWWSKEGSRQNFLSRNNWMWHLVIWSAWHAGVHSKVGLSDFVGFSDLSDSMILFSPWSIPKEHLNSQV